MGGLHDSLNEVPLSLISSLFGIWVLAWVMGFFTAHVIRSVLDVLKNSVDD